MFQKSSNFAPQTWLAYLDLFFLNSPDCATGFKWRDAMWWCSAKHAWEPRFQNWQAGRKRQEVNSTFKTVLQRSIADLRGVTHGYEHDTPLVLAAELPLLHRFYYICSAWSLKIFAVALLSLHGIHTSKWIIFIHVGQTYFQLRVSESCWGSFQAPFNPNWLLKREHFFSWVVGLCGDIGSAG